MTGDGHLTFAEYQQAAIRTAGGGGPADKPLMGAIGLAGEAGEVCDALKKVFFHGHGLDRDKLAEEIGDVLWYCALLADTLGVDLGSIAQKNIEKLYRRYPDGFSTERSVNRSV